MGETEMESNNRGMGEVKERIRNFFFLLSLFTFSPPANQPIAWHSLILLTPLMKAKRKRKEWKRIIPLSISSLASSSGDRNEKD